MLARIPISFVAAILLHPHAGAAHEFWLEPAAHILSAGDTVEANLKVGQDYSGSTHSYLPDRFEKFLLTNRTGTREVPGTVGDVPAASLANLPEGLQIISYQSTPNELIFTDWQKFTNYVNYEGNGWAIDTHLQSGLSQAKFKEAYKRYAKTLVQIGSPVSGSDADRAVGMTLELVVLGSPYIRNPKQDVPVQLLWQGKPLAGQQINIFQKAKSTGLTSVTTNQDGRAMIPVVQSGRYMLNAVHMALNDTDADIAWDSHWASLTFEIGGTE